MGFWFFMLVMALLIPVTMLGVGWLFMKKAPKDIDYVFGYRTRRSMKNEATWAFAHRYIGRLWFICGLILLPIAVIPMLLVIGKDADTVGTTGGILTVIQLLPLAGSIIPTEKALKKHFDESGRPR